MSFLCPECSACSPDSCLSLALFLLICSSLCVWGFRLCLCCKLLFHSIQHFSIVVLISIFNTVFIYGYVLRLHRPRSIFICSSLHIEHKAKYWTHNKWSIHIWWMGQIRQRESRYVNRLENWKESSLYKNTMSLVLDMLSFRWQLSMYNTLTLARYSWRFWSHPHEVVDWKQIISDWKNVICESL